jgi:polyphosphate kinase
MYASKKPLKIVKKRIYRYVNRDLSWLSFNDRVLQEAHDPTVPLIERFRFMGIFSNNLDEFFRVRVASLSRLERLDKKDKQLLGFNPGKILKQIKQVVLKQQQVFEKLYNDVLIKELAEQKVFLINETQLNVTRGQYVKEYFRDKLISNLVPVMVEPDKPFPFLKDRSIYLFIKLFNSNEPEKYKLSLIEIPTDFHSRFITLPETNNLKFIILLDDVIRYCLHEIYQLFNYNDYEAYTIKMTRDAELDIDLSDLKVNILDSFSKGLKERKKGRPVRFVYDQSMPRDLVMYLRLALNLSIDNLIPGGRYHNFKDFMGFPNVGLQHLEYNKIKPLELDSLSRSHSMFNEISKNDHIVHFPYQKFDYVVRFLREAAIDPKVESIKITLYRIANNSMVANALINAARNGKKITVILELKARFDEEHNILWTQRFLEEGVTVLHSVPEMKIHSKICLVERKEKGKSAYYAQVSTGNYNEKTSGIYCDHSLFTANRRVTTDLVKLFGHLEKGSIKGAYKNLLVAPLNLRAKLIQLIQHESLLAKSGKKGVIMLKLNSLSDEEVIGHLYDASRAGVKIRIIVRGICCLIPGKKDMSENIEVISIVDRFLEHARVYFFGNNGKDLLYISSADVMSRNLDNRVEVAVPIYDKKIREEIMDIINIQWADNTKARIINELQNNLYKMAKGDSHRSQMETYNYLKEKY